MKHSLRIINQTTKDKNRAILGRHAGAILLLATINPCDHVIKPPSHVFSLNPLILLNKKVELGGIFNGNIPLNIEAGQQYFPGGFLVNTTPPILGVKVMDDGIKLDLEHPQPAPAVAGKGEVVGDKCACKAACKCNDKGADELSSTHFVLLVLAIPLSVLAAVLGGRLGIWMSEKWDGRRD